MDGQAYPGAAVSDTAGRRVAAARQHCITAFAAVAERLSGVHGDAMALTTQAGALRAMLEQSDLGTDPLADVRAALAGLRTAMDRASANDCDGMPLMQAGSALSAIQTEARRLSAISSLTLIAAQSLGAAGLRDYVEGLRKLKDRLGDDATKLQQGLGSVIGSRQRVAAAIALANGALDRAAIDLAADEGDGAADAAQAALTAVTDLERTLHTATGRETKALIAAIQFSDSMAQRLEHVETILGMAAGREEAVAALVVAQLAAIAEDARAVCATADSALVRLARTAGDTRVALQAQTEGSGVALLLRRQRDSIGRVVACEETLGPALLEAAGAAGEIEGALTEALRRFEALGGSADRITLSAINATLLSARTGSAKGPLAVLAEAVREGAQVCTQRADICRGAMAVLADSLDAQAFAAFGTAMEGFRTAVTACTAQLDAAEAAERGLGAIRMEVSAAADSLAAAAADARRALAAIGPQLAALADAGTGPAAGSVDPEQLRSILGIYTMDREREVHAALCNEPVSVPAGRPGPASEPAAGTGEDDPLAAILF
ncbi:MAG: hypothetical protein ACXIU8_11755 [Alkalilacustris sp.]